MIEYLLPNKDCATLLAIAFTVNTFFSANDGLRGWARSFVKSKIHRAIEYVRGEKIANFLENQKEENKKTAKRLNKLLTHIERVQGRYEKDLAFMNKAFLIWMIFTSVFSIICLYIGFINKFAADMSLAPLPASLGLYILYMILQSALIKIYVYRVSRDLSVKQSEEAVDTQNIKHRIDGLSNSIKE
jgi:hypothetical protein